MPTPAYQSRPDEVIHVLLVEDDVFVRFDLGDALRLAGYTVIEASSAEQGLDLIASGARVDVVVSDYRLLGAMNGLQLHQKLVQRRPDLPFILTSARVLPEVAKLDTVPFLRKPYSPVEVLRMIDTKVNGAHRPS